MSTRRLAELHIHRARTKALRVFAFTSSVYPSEWQKAYIETFVMDLFDFAFHARRVNDLCGISDDTFVGIDKYLVVIGSGAPSNVETNYRYALNALVHTAEFVFGNAVADHRRIFTQSEENLTPLYVKIKTDKYKETSISIFGVINCFLTAVIPKIKERHPEFLF